MGVPLAEASSPSGRRWNPLDIAVSAAVDTAGNGPPTVCHGDADGLRFRASADGFARYGGRASLRSVEHCGWREKAAAGVSPSALLREAMSRTRTWTASALGVESQRICQIALIGNNL